MDDYKNIKLTIAGRNYPLKIKASEEETIRRINKELNEKINHFQMTYSTKDKQDSLAMTLMTYAVDLNRYKNQASIKDADQELSEVEDLLDSLL
ncbi:MAG: cell division protein ZapA [Saprospiraceae bacterium]